MRIGIDARLLGETGVGRYIDALLTHLPLSSKHTFVAYVLGKNKEKAVKKYPQHEIVVADIAWHSFSEQTQLPRIFVKGNLDLVHIPYFSVPLLLSVPYVVTIHDLIISHRPTGRATTKALPIYFAKRMGYRVVVSKAIKRARAIITVSETVKNQIHAEYPTVNNIYVTYESGEMSTVSVKNQLPKVHNYILYVGNAHPHKNLETLLSAFELLTNSFLDLQLVLVGKKDYFYTRLMNHISKKTWASRVHQVGEVDEAQLIQWYRHARAFVFPSLEEGFGIPGLEAMLQGCAVAASDIPIFHEIYQDCAVYFNPHRPMEIAQSLSQILRSSNIDIIRRGKRHAAQFSWRKMAQETVDIYENCIHI